MIAEELLEILVCPETKEPVRPAPPELLERLNAAIAAGGVVNRGGQTVAEPLQEGLVRADGAVLYPVRDDIPVMLIDEGIPLAELGDA
ncbi:MAG: Trm112 family protein [Gemmatimonadota bacterium]